MKLNELLAALKKYGVQKLPTSRGKGSETILIKPTGDDPTKGPQYPIKNHGPGTEITIPVIRAALRRFKILEDEFWD